MPRTAWKVLGVNANGEDEKRSNGMLAEDEKLWREKKAV